MTDTLPARNIRASRVEGAQVRNSAGDRLGLISDLVVGKIDGQVKYAIMSFGGFLGLGEDYHPIPWDRLRYDRKQESYVVDLTREQLQGAPGYARDSEPDWNDPVYGRQIYDFYGLPPLV